MNYLIKFTSSTAEVCKPVHKLTSLKNGWMWNNIHQKLCARENHSSRKSCPQHSTTRKKQLYLETDAPGASIRESLLQTSDGMQFPKDDTPDNMPLWPIAFRA